MNTDRRENPLVSLLFNIVIPSLILTKLSEPERLGALYALLVALAFPISYGLYEFRQAKRVGFIPALGLINVLLTGGLGLLQVNVIWFAVKEAVVPLVIGAAIILSNYTRQPLIKALLYNKSVIAVDRIEEQLAKRNTRAEFEQMLVRVSFMFGASFLLSAVLNFVLAVVILRSPAGSTEFNQELGRMTALSFPVIVVPCLIIGVLTFWYLLNKIKALTTLSLDEIMNK
ncbi:MAG: MFS transporter [Pseudomonadota bacterium]|nr:MFS transporter [Pseudomonadota bacterium]